MTRTPWRGTALSPWLHSPSSIFFPLHLTCCPATPVPLNSREHNQLQRFKHQQARAKARRTRGHLVRNSYCRDSPELSSSLPAGTGRRVPAAAAAGWQQPPARAALPAPVQLRSAPPEPRPAAASLLSGSVRALHPDGEKRGELAGRQKTLALGMVPSTSPCPPK